MGLPPLYGTSMRIGDWEFMHIIRYHANLCFRILFSAKLMVLCLIGSLVLSNSIFAGSGLFMNSQAASAQVGSMPQPLGSLSSMNPFSADFLTLAIGLVPHIPGVDLNTSHLQNSIRCDVRVPLTYVDGGCMSVLPLLFPFTSSTYTPFTIANQSAMISEVNGTLSPIALSIGVISENLSLGNDQTVTVTTSNESSSIPIEEAAVNASVVDSAGSEIGQYSGLTDISGQTSFTFTIPTDASAGTFGVDVNASAPGFEPAFESTSFEVLPSDFLFADNSSDFFSDGSSSSSDGSSSSSSSSDDFTSPTVKSTDPNDGDSNVPLDTDVTVTFSEKIDQDTLDDGSLDIFNLDTGIDPGVNANPSSKSVTYTLDRQLEPGTRYEAQLDFNIQDDNGNYLDCSNSNDVDSSCTWQFETTTTSNSADIILSPNSGPVLTSVAVTGTGFAPGSTVNITFNGTARATSPAIVTPSANGIFFANFTVPVSSFGLAPVIATQGTKSASEQFLVTDIPAATLSSTQQLGTNLSNASSIEPPSNQTNATVPVVTNSSFDTTESNGTVILQNNTPSLNASSTQATENTSTAPTAKRINNTSLIASTDNKVNENPDTSASTQTNDTSNSKKNSEKSISIGRPKSIDQPISRALTNDNTTNEKSSSVTEDKTITQVTSPDSNNRPDKRSVSSDTSPRDMVLFYKYLHSGNDDAKPEREGKELSQDVIEVNNRPVAINDKAVTDTNVPVNINILRNDKDVDGDKLSIMGLSPPLQGTIVSNPNGMIAYSPLKSWSGTETFAYSISDGRGGVASASVTVIVQPTRTENHLPEAQDQDVSVNENSPVKIKLEAKDPDDDKLRFVLESKPSHGRIVQFSSSTGTLTYVPDENYDGKDIFGFKVHDGTVFSKNAEVAIKIQNNEKLSNDQQPNRDFTETPANEKKTIDEKTNSDMPPNDSSQQSTSSTQDTEQQKKDQKEEDPQSSEPAKPTSDTDTAPSGDSQPTPNSDKNSISEK